MKIWKQFETAISIKEDDIIILENMNDIFVDITYETATDSMDINIEFFTITDGIKSIRIDSNHKLFKFFSENIDLEKIKDFCWEDWHYNVDGV